MLPSWTTAARLNAAHDLSIEEVEVPRPGDGEVLLRILAVGLCGSDAHWYEEGSIGDSRLTGGLILGHEVCGVVESGPRRGERVVIDPAIPCLACEECRRGRHNTCPNVVFAGHGETDGGLRGHMVWPERCLTSVPPGTSVEAAALLEPLGVALHAVELGRVDATDSVGVVGCGPIGLLIALALQERGVGRIAASDPLSHRLSAAADLGVDTLSFPPSGEGLDVVFDAAGTDEAMAEALDRVRPGGRVVVVGIPPGDRTTLRASVARRKELVVSWCRRMGPDDLAKAADIASRHPDRLERLVSHRFDLSEVTDAFETLVARRGLKILVWP